MSFTSSDGPAVLKLDRKDGETAVSLVVRNPDAATKAGMMPKPGQAKLLLGNALPAEAAVTIDNKTVKVAGGAERKVRAARRSIFLPANIRIRSRCRTSPSSATTLKSAPAKPGGLLIGPGGAMQMQVY